MNLDRNRIPPGARRVHLIAVCGTGMGALACVLREKGIRVTGSDRNIYPPMSTFLADRGIRPMDGFREENLPADADLVVVGNAVTRDNPEVKRMAEMKKPFCSMPQAVNHFMGEGKKSLVVTGTHGKTTTASLLAWILHCAGLDPSFLIGGILNNFKSNYRNGSGPHLVLEGDEYDTAFFDKQPKLHHYRPHMAVLTGVEFDHADIFRDLDHLKTEFGRFISAMGPEDLLFTWDGSPTVAELVRNAACRVLTYGTSPASDWTLDKTVVAPPWTRFTVRRRGEAPVRLRTRLMGEHNRINALSAIGMAAALGVPMTAAAEALETFEGVRRRQEIRGTVRGITVVDDFAHHPTAVRETLRAVRPHCGDGRLIAVFEPRTNSSMRGVFQAAYPEALEGADRICVRIPSLLHKIPEGERFSTEKLVADLRARGKEAHCFPEAGGIIDHLVGDARSGDWILIMSNGGFDNIHERLLLALEERETNAGHPAGRT